MRISAEIQSLLHLIADRASKLEHARSRPENQTPEMLAAIRWVDQSTDNNVDKAILWIVREIRKERIQGRLRQGKYWAVLSNPSDAGYNGDISDTWFAFFNHLEDWIDAKRPNLMSLTLQQVAEQMMEWDEELKNAKPYGDYEEQNVVHTFDDGWTVQKVTTAHDLKVEGQKMGHCVGGYCDNVQSGKSYIYSLRDPKNEPHITMEMGQSASQEFSFKQIKGKGNDAPKPEYSGYIYEWIIANTDEKKFQELAGLSEDGSSFKSKVINRAESAADDSDLSSYVSDAAYEYERGDTSHALLVEDGYGGLIYNEVSLELGEQSQQFMSWVSEQPAYEELRRAWENAWSDATYSREDTEKAYVARFGEGGREPSSTFSGDIQPTEVISWKDWDEQGSIDESFLQKGWGGDRRAFFTDLAEECGSPRSDDYDSEDIDQSVSELSWDLESIMISNLEKVRDKYLSSFIRSALPRLIREFQASGDAATSYTTWEPTRQRPYNINQLLLPFEGARRSLIEANHFLRSLDA